MDDDVDMDAPLISTLPEEKTPPPSRRKADSARKKKPKASAPSTPFQLAWRKSGSGRVSDGEPAEEGEPEDEEDQLIDDEDDVATPAASVSGKTPDAAPKKKGPTKRKARAEEEGGGKKRTKKDASSVAKSRKPSGGSEPTPSESFDDGTDIGTGANTPSISIVESEPQDTSSASKAAKKKSTPRKSAPKAAKGKPSGLKMVIPALSAIAADDTASVMSEGGTAASSPVTGVFEKSQPGSPDPEQIAPSSPVAAPSAPLAEETNLENIPLPIYPLPSKPFPIQQPTKIPTGFAPPLPLDKSGKKVRHWRTAHREIRGIAGGRWFARSWVGDKDSEYATFAAARESEKANGLLSLPKQSSTSASAPPLGRGSGKKAKGASSLNASAAPSRDPSVVPQEIPGTGGNGNGSTGANATPIPIATSTVRAPTKMRIQQLPEDPQSDTAMDTDPIPVPPSEA